MKLAIAPTMPLGIATMAAIIRTEAEDDKIREAEREGAVATKAMVATVRMALA